MNGFWMHKVAVGWLAWQLTGSALWLGIIAFADLIPAILIGPIAGAFADRHSRLRINIVCQVLAMIQALILWFLTATDIITIHILLALTLLLAFVLAFNQPARMSLVPSLVRPSDITAAIAVNSVSFNLARFIGPAAAGIVITTMGIAPAFLINALTFVIFIIAMFQLRLPPQKFSESAAGGIFADILQGFRYAAVHPAIGPLLLIITATSILAAPVLELLPGFADAVFGRGADGLAWLTSASGIGATIGGIWLAKRGHAHRTHRADVAWRHLGSGRHGRSIHKHNHILGRRHRNGIRRVCAADRWRRWPNACPVNCRGTSARPRNGNLWSHLPRWSRR